MDLRKELWQLNLPGEHIDREIETRLRDLVTNVNSVRQLARHDNRPESTMEAVEILSTMAVACSTIILLLSYRYFSKKLSHTEQKNSQLETKIDELTISMNKANENLIDKETMIKDLYHRIDELSVIEGRGRNFDNSYDMKSEISKEEVIDQLRHLRDTRIQNVADQLLRQRDHQAQDLGASRSLRDVRANIARLILDASRSDVDEIRDEILQFALGDALKIGFPLDETLRRDLDDVIRDGGALLHQIDRMRPPGTLSWPADGAPFNDAAHYPLPGRGPYDVNPGDGATIAETIFPSWEIDGKLEPAHVVLRPSPKQDPRSSRRVQGPQVKS